MAIMRDVAALGALASFVVMLAFVTTGLERFL